MESVDRRLFLGVAAVALLLGLCVFAVVSVRGRLHAGSASAPAPAASAPLDAAGLAAENRALRARVAQLRSERDAALARLHALQAQGQAAPAAPGAPAPPAHPAVQHEAAPPPQGGFTEPQTFSSVSTSP